jgi:hypothetical protein
MRSAHQGVRSRAGAFFSAPPGMPAPAGDLPTARDSAGRRDGADVPTRAM